MVVAALVLAQAALALELALPQGARQTVERNTGPDSYDAPVAAFDGRGVPAVTLEGTIERRAWRVPTAGLTTLQVMAPLRRQLEELGYELVFECASKGCGGFDFRFAAEVLPGPNMYVNIGRFRFLTAVRGPREAPTEVVTVLVSATAASAYVQIVHAETGQVAPAPAAAVPEVAVTGPLPAPTKMTSLIERGFVVLADLDFATGTSTLGPGPYGSLQELADLLTARGDLRIALVGHTDAVGGLAANLAVSKARAEAVRRRLIDAYGVESARLDAEGIAYLGPIASNLTEEGRQRNRRVEAVLLNTE
jgi:OOP family OmpA-OmpF porin